MVIRLSALFALDAFAGGLIVQAMIAYWFHVKFGIDAGIIGSIFFGANILAGISVLLAIVTERSRQRHIVSGFISHIKWKNYLVDICRNF